MTREATGPDLEDTSTPQARPWTATLLGARRQLLAALVLGAAAGFGISFLVTPTYTAKVSILPPQQQQSAAAAALASLGSLASLTGVGASIRTPADQYAALMQSKTVEERLIDRFKLQDVYAEKLRVDARTLLEKRTRVGVGKRDGLITVEVDDSDPQRAADIANQYIAELRTLTSGLAVSEAQQRRAFFENLLGETRNKLTVAQRALEQTGVSSSTLRSEPRSAAEIYGQLKAQVTASEVRLQTMRSGLAESTPEVVAQRTQLDALRMELARMERSQTALPGSDYIGKYREFKYHEALFELFARQYELARVDESREGTLIQVIDAATPPEKRSWPRRSVLAVAGALAALILTAVLAIARSYARHSAPADG